VDKTTWRDPALRRPGGVALPSGSVRYFDVGRGAPLVFVHGLLVNANLWRHVVSMLEREYRCICLDLPLGAHTTPMRSDADLRPPALADVIGDALEQLALDGVTLIGNDTGGALCQPLVTRRPERIGRLVLTSCDYRDNLPPAMFRYLTVAARIPGALPALLAQMRVRRLRRLRLPTGGSPAIALIRWSRISTCDPVSPSVASGRTSGGYCGLWIRGTPLKPPTACAISKNRR
jgi:pimeloyl-ACP methyl ester carboxylesterase